jgi:hypothetical protein
MRAIKTDGSSHSGRNAVHAYDDRHEQRRCARTALGEDPRSIDWDCPIFITPIIAGGELDHIAGRRVKLLNISKFSDVTTSHVSVTSW